MDCNCRSNRSFAFMPWKPEPGEEFIGTVEAVSVCASDPHELTGPEPSRADLADCYHRDVKAVLHLTRAPNGEPLDGEPYLVRIALDFEEYGLGGDTTS